MVCKKMGEEVNSYTSFLTQHFSLKLVYSWFLTQTFFLKLVQLQDIRQMFDKFGPVEEITVLRDDQGVSRGKYFPQSRGI